MHYVLYIKIEKKDTLDTNLIKSQFPLLKELRNRILRIIIAFNLVPNASFGYNKQTKKRPWNTSDT